MVARTPPKQPRKMVVVAAPPISPTLLRDTVKKVDKCMARLQELQYTVTNGGKVVSGVNLSPRSGRNYLRTSLRCKQESLRLKNATSRRSSPPGKLPVVNTEEWRKMSLPAMLLGETMGEIIQASQFAKVIVEAVSNNTQKPANDDPKTPLTERRKREPTLENSGLQSRRRREKQVVLKNIRSESNMPSLQRAKSKINFKVSSPVQNRECDKENCRYIANRVSPRNRPWVKKTVLFPNPLFHSSPTSHHQKFYKTKSPVISRNRVSPHKFLIKTPTKSKSPVIARNQRTPHKFLVKSPPRAMKLQVKIKSPPLAISPTRASGLSKRTSPKRAAMLSKLRRSFSPSRLANRLVSPMKSRKSVQKNEGTKIMRGMKQRPTSFSVRFSPRRI